jgi:hypothetical protein
LQFGPAHADSGVLTSGVAGYYVHFATDCFGKIGEHITYVHSNSSEPRACCTDDAYIAVLNGVKIPDLATRLMVTINTSLAGELPTGVSTAISDRSFVPKNKSTNTRGVAKDSAKRFCGHPSVLYLLFSMAATMTCVGPLTNL